MSKPQGNTEVKIKVTFLRILTAIFGESNFINMTINNIQEVVGTRVLLSD